MSQPQTDATVALAGAVRGDPTSASRLMPLLYDELRRLADRYLRRQPPGHTLQPTALVHEAYLKLIDQKRAGWTDRAYFFAVAATAMRQILVDHARAKRTQKRGAQRQRVTIAYAEAQPNRDEVDLLLLDEALEKLARLNDRKSRVVELRFFAGLTIEEAAQVLQVSPTTVEGDWRFARAWLRDQLSEEVAR